MRLTDAFPSLTRRSSLPVGGTPADDRDFIAWLGAICDAENRRRLDNHYWAADSVRIVSPFQVSAHLYKLLVGWEFPTEPDSAEGPTHNHRLRFLAIQWRLRPDEIAALVTRFLESYP